MKRVFFNPDTSTLSILPSDLGEGIALPETVGIVWHHDQSCNQIILSGDLRGANYTFRPVDDLPLLTEYLDQIEDFYA